MATVLLLPWRRDAPSSHGACRGDDARLLLPAWQVLTIMEYLNSVASPLLVATALSAIVSPAALLGTWFFANTHAFFPFHAVAEYAMLFVPLLVVAQSGWFFF